MEARVPLSDVQDVSEAQVRSQVAAPVQAGLSDVTKLKGIDGLKDLRELALLLGFDNGFDIMGKEAEDVYNWAKELTGQKGGPAVNLTVKQVIKETGMAGKGPELLRKLHRWVSLDTKMKALPEEDQKVLDLRMNQMVVENG